MRGAAQKESDATRRRLVRTPGAAQYLGLAVSTLEKARVHGSGPKFVRLGGRAIAYDYADLDDWVNAQQKASSTSETVKGKTRAI